MLSARSTITLALAVSLGALPLAACTGQATPSATTSAATSAATSATTSATFDVASWKTLGDALATATDTPSWGYDEKTFVCLFQAGSSYAKVVCEEREGLDDKLGTLNSDQGADAAKQLAQAIGDLPIKSARDITPELLGSAELEALKGKTGQQLVDEGFVFESYNMYGGEQTGVSFGKGSFSYLVTLGTQTSEQEADKGELTQAVLDAKVVEAQSTSFSNAAFSAE